MWSSRKSSTDLADHPTGSGACQPEGLAALDRLPAASGGDDVAPRGNHGGILPPNLDRTGGQPPLLGRAGAEPFREPPLFFGREVRLDRTKKRHVLPFNRPRIGGDDAANRRFIVFRGS